MSQAAENHPGAPHWSGSETALSRLAELAQGFGAQQISSSALSLAERTSAGLFYVACIGQFKRGKSTLLNALIGNAVLPTGVTPVTTVPSIVRYGDVLSARVLMDGSEWTEISPDALDEYVSEAKNPENKKGVAALEVFVPSDLLKTGMCLVDTPGLGSVFAGNTVATHAFVPQIDAALVVIGADPPLSGEELELVEKVGRQVGELLFVLNKADKASSNERQAATEFARNVLTKRLRREITTVFQVSALQRLEGREGEADWKLLVQALEDLVRNSGRSLVREAMERGIRSASQQLLEIVIQEREILLRPILESERRLAELRETLSETKGALRDLSALLGAEQQRLSATFAQMRELFLKRAIPEAAQELRKGLSFLASSRNGPAYRRKVNHLAQQIARGFLTPWLAEEGKHAEEEFHKTAKRFTELGNAFLRRLREAGVHGLNDLPEELRADEGLETRSQFHFHVIERVAAPASPFLFVRDLIAGAFGLRDSFMRSGQEFLEQLLEVNSARVESDVVERVAESRRSLEVAIKGTLREASAIAEQALVRAREAQSSGAPAVEAALVRLDALDRELRGLMAGATQR